MTSTQVEDKIPSLDPLGSLSGTLTREAYPIVFVRLPLYPIDLLLIMRAKVSVHLGLGEDLNEFNTLRYNRTLIGVESDLMPTRGHHLNVLHHLLGVRTRTVVFVHRSMREPEDMKVEGHRFTSSPQGRFSYQPWALS